MSFFDKIAAAGGSFRTAKDAAVISAELHSYFRRGEWYGLVRRLLRLYKEKGEMLRLSLDSQNKQLEIEVQLRGQSEPLRVVARDYELAGSDAAPSIIFKQIETSQGWLNVLLKTLRFNEKELPLPPQYAELIQLVL